jgi:hypothetical protein
MHSFTTENPNLACLKHPFAGIVTENLEKPKKRTLMQPTGDSPESRSKSALGALSAK